MASITLFLLFALLFANTVTNQQNHSTFISLGSSISPKNSTSWVSPSGLFTFGFYPQGNGFAVEIWLKGEPQNTTVWTAKRDDPPVSSDSIVYLTVDGLMLLRRKEDNELLTDNVSMPPVASACMLDSGNFVLYNESHSVIWQSFDFTTHTLLGGQNFSYYDTLISALSNSDHSSGYFALCMDYDGNLTAYPMSYESNVYWSTNALLKYGISTIPKFYVVANSTSYVAKNATLVYRATLHVDGNFRFYCSKNGTKSVCQCYPGFVQFKSDNNMFLECKRTRNETNDDLMLLYDVITLPDMNWSTPPYLAMPLNLKACEKSCKEDWDCRAAFYTSGSCKKYKLPLRFGRIVHNESGIAILKLPIGTKAPPNITTPSGGKSILVDDKKSLILTLILTLGSISFVCFVAALSIFFIYKHQVSLYTKLSTNENLGFTEDYSLRTFSFDELVNSTGNFKEEVGKGSFETVYRGTIHGSNKRVAVKKLDVLDEGNLVQLLGYCIDGSRKLLVYEYMSNGSLADFLFKAEMHLSWRERVKIAFDVARGVLYLHEECEVCIVHCNIKPQNILMDEMWTAKVSDFGLARLSIPEHSRTTSANESTSGYVAPEGQKDALASVKVDVYSYGVVLLEIICCRRNIDVKVSSEEEIMLSTWVYNCFVRGELNKLAVDDEDVEWKTMERMVKVGLWCIQENLSLRPSMKNVILMLEGLKDIPTPPCLAPLVG
ncbi:G-type lectin S-receptor-like serine/threonine-protein kinase LECRK1 [Prosopis cineraria]|uniref:G-type lectin S-receptor-like serine/threonine-protein kinase LECRK1 n=1 Tax=Prosopis cineraria TaxID=364024 RepID=UPI00240FBBFD|nr:G-type lectin S-receptor-like serine/threonine-protein kinase LECRK1 [Prosopis cineraria]